MPDKTLKTLHLMDALSRRGAVKSEFATTNFIILGAVVKGYCFVLVNVLFGMDISMKSSKYVKILKGEKMVMMGFLLLIESQYA